MNTYSQTKGGGPTAPTACNSYESSQRRIKELEGALKDTVEAFEEYAADWEEDSVGVHVLKTARAALAAAKEGKA